VFQKAGLKLVKWNWTAVVMGWWLCYRQWWNSQQRLLSPSYRRGFHDTSESDIAWCLRNCRRERTVLSFYCAYTPWSIKIGHYIIGDNFVRCEPIFAIFAPLGKDLNCQQNLSNISHFTLTLHLNELPPTLPWEI